MLGAYSGRSGPPQTSTPSLQASVPVLGAYTGRRAPIVAPTSRPKRSTGGSTSGLNSGQSQGAVRAGRGEPFQPQFKGSAAAAASPAAPAAAAPAVSASNAKEVGSLKGRIRKVLGAGDNSGFYTGAAKIAERKAKAEAKRSAPAPAAPAPVAAAPVVPTPTVAPASKPASSTGGDRSGSYRSGPSRTSTTASAPVVPTPAGAMGTERGSGRVVGSPSSEGSSQDYLVRLCLHGTRTHHMPPRTPPHSSSHR